MRSPSADRTLLSWTDGKKSLGGSVVRPPKEVWLEERSIQSHSSTFTIFRLYDNLIRRVLAHVGGKTESQLDQIATRVAGTDRVSSERSWNVPAATGLRLRSVYAFRNDFGLESPRLTAHRLGQVDVHVGAKAETSAISGVPIGAGGEGKIEGEILFATDPAVRVQALLPWRETERSLLDFTRAYFDEIAAAVEIDPSVAMQAFEDAFLPFLPDENRMEWALPASDIVEGREGDRVPFTLRITAPRPGRSLIAVQAEDCNDQALTACSEILAIEVTERQDILLFDDVESVSSSWSSPPKQVDARTQPARRRTAGAPRKALVDVVADETSANLKKIDHIVVLMLENRSFDHMLGYLSLEGARPDVDGLKASMSNSYRGKTYKVRHLQRTALTKDEDPCQSGACVAEQVSNNMGGFVSNFAKQRTKAKLLDVVMGYYNGADVPVYDHLANEFCVCDKWFSSVPGATWPNRLYALAGHAAGSKDGRRVPIYDEPSFVRHLESHKVSWRWYSHDVGTLRFSDSEFSLGHLKRFAYFDRRSFLAPRNFLDDAAQGNLPAVSWIDPNFVDVSFIGPSGSNDDHPPSDIKAGQELVLKLYSALVKSPQWSKTMLVITYDEHGGFYDHVTPPAARDDKPAFRTYGVRVPSIVVSPFTERASVSNVLYDHTSIIKTILMRFCARNGQIPDMGARVGAANHLGDTLGLASPRPPTPQQAFRGALDHISSWRTDVFRSRVLMEPLSEPADPRDLNDLQQQVLAAKKELRARGLPEGQP